MAIHKHDLYIPLEEDAVLWRYMDLQKFESLLKNSALFFCRADKFSDVFEGSIPRREEEYRMKAERDAAAYYGKEFDEAKAIENIEGRKILHQKIRRGTTVNCWHINNDESDGMWQLYLKDNEGIAIQSNCKRITECFSEIETNIEMSKIRYLNYETDIWYHEKDYPHYSYNVIAPIFHKRIEFKHEAEFRVFITNQEANDNENYWGDEKGINIEVDIGLLIEKIVLHPSADEVGIKKVTALLEKYGYAFQVEKSKLSNNPYY